MKQGILVCVALWICLKVSSQQFGAIPGSLKWQQINTDTVKIIFPGGMYKEANRLTDIIHRLQKNQSASIGNRLQKISILLHNQLLTSNAYVGLAPYRSEFYLQPPRNPFELGAVYWTDNLAIHEFRHVEQYSNFNNGLSKLASVFLGEQGRAVANAASIPDWLFEGDAVFNETKLSRQGRGVLPLFLSHYRALSEADRKYSYAKMRNGSFRQYVPNHYDLGYLLVAYGRKKYGENIWKDITKDASAFKPLFYPFQGAFQKHTGMSYKKFVEETLGYYHHQWQPFPSDEVKWISPVSDKKVVNYKYPYAMGDGAVMVLKSSGNAIPAFYRLQKNGVEERISVKNISPDDYYGYNANKLIYAAYHPDSRWGYREFTDITLLDLDTRETRKIFSRKRYFSPDISHDGKKVIAVETDGRGGSQLVQMDDDGKVVNAIVSDKMVYSHPKFSANDDYAFVPVRNLTGEMALLKYSLTGNASVDTLLPFSNRIIGFPQVQGDTLSFTTTYAGRDESWVIIDGTIPRGPYRLATYVTGIYQACILPEGKIGGSAFTADGYRLGVFNPLWERVAVKNELSMLRPDSLFPKADLIFLEDTVAGKFPFKPYSRSFQLFNFHSYRPNYEQPEYSFTLYGQNVLNTLQSELSYTWNQNEQSHGLGYTGIYGGWYLQPVFGAKQIWHRTQAFNKDTTVNWNEQKAYAGLQLPLNLSGGKQYRYLTLSALFTTQQVKWTGLGTKFLNDARFNYLQSRISFNSQIQKALQHIYPHWAQSISLQYKNILNTYSANQFLATGAVYLPGLNASHSLVLTAAYQSRDTMQQYLFSNDFPFSRGYSAVDFPRLWKVGVNYHFPLFYPDWGFANIVYFLRIRSNVFYDYTQGKSLRTGTVYPFHTVGTELFFDTRWWNQQPVTFGIRYSRLLDNAFRGPTQPNVWEIILPVNLFN